MYYFLPIAVMFLSVEWNPKTDVELQSLTVTFAGASAKDVGSTHFCFTSLGCTAGSSTEKHQLGNSSYLFHSEHDEPVKL